MRRYFHAASQFEFVLLLLLGLLWGIPYALTKISLETIPPITMVAARVSVAAVVLWVTAILLGRKVPLRWDFVGHAFVQGSICVISYTLIAFGQQSVDSGLAAILNSATPLFVCLIGVTWARHEPISIGRLSGALIGLGGVVVITGASALIGLGRETAGQAAILLATFCSAVSVVHGRRFIRIDPEVAAAGMLTSAAIMLMPMCLMIEAPWRTAPSAASVAALGANALIATAFGFVIYFHLIRKIGSMGTSSSSLLKPSVGVLIGVTLMGEALTWTLTFGLLAILIGVAVINERVSIQSLSNAVRYVGSRLIRRNDPFLCNRNGPRPR